MIEIVFNESACGSLKIAQNYGRGKYQSGTFGVIISQDGRELTAKEIECTRREYAKKERLAWEKATPMNGNVADIYGFNLALSIGSISEIKLGSERQKVLEELYSIFPYDHSRQVSQKLLEKAEADLKTVYKRVEAGEDLRIWYSNHPDELCGLYWFITQLSPIIEDSGKIFLIKLPDWETDEKGHTKRKVSLGEVAPGEWSKYLKFQEILPPRDCKFLKSKWQTLQMENASLRAVLNGQLMSVSDTIYDSYIIDEIVQEKEKFQEAVIIGRVLEKYQLGISDYWIALRIEEMIQNGKLEAVTKPEIDCPIYHRILKKCIDL